MLYSMRVNWLSLVLIGRFKPNRSLKFGRMDYWQSVVILLVSNKARSWDCLARTVQENRLLLA